jgi:hypothetical protein
MTQPRTKRIPRGTPETITEEKLTIPSGTVVNVCRNLSPLSLTRLMEQTKENSVRAMIVGDDVLYWDSFAATNQDVAQALGIEYIAEDRVEIFRLENEALVVEVPKPEDEPRGALAKLSSPNIYFQKPTGEWESNPLD